MGNRIAKLYTRSKVGYRKPGKRLTDLPEGETYTLFWYIGTKKKAKAVGRYADEAQVALINCGKVWVLEQSLPNACVTVCSKGGFSLLLFAKPGKGRGADQPQVIAHGYFGAADEDSDDRVLRPASVYSPNKRMVAIPSKVTGTHIPPSSANCKVI